MPMPPRPIYGMPLAKVTYDRLSYVMGLCNRSTLEHWWARPGSLAQVMTELTAPPYRNERQFRRPGNPYLKLVLSLVLPDLVKIEIDMHFDPDDDDCPLEPPPDFLQQRYDFFRAVNQYLLQEGIAVPLPS